MWFESILSLDVKLWAEFYALIQSTDLCRRCTFQMRLFQLKTGAAFEIGFPLFRNYWKSNSSKVQTSLLFCFFSWLDQKRLSLMFWSEHLPPLVQVQINCQHNSYLPTLLGKRVENSIRSRTKLRHLCRYSWSKNCSFAIKYCFCTCCLKLKAAWQIRNNFEVQIEIEPFNVNCDFLIK